MVQASPRLPSPQSSRLRQRVSAEVAAAVGSPPGSRSSSVMRVIPSREASCVIPSREASCVIPSRETSCPTDAIIAAQVALDFARLMGTSNCSDLHKCRSGSPSRFSASKRPLSPASTRLSSAATTHLSSTEPPLSTTRFSSAGTALSSTDPAFLSDDDAGGALSSRASSRMRPRKLYPEVLVQTRDTPLATPRSSFRKPEGSNALELDNALVAEVADAEAAASHESSNEDNAGEYLPLVREQMQSIEKSRGQLQSQMERIDKLLEEIGAASELQAPCSPRDVPGACSQGISRYPGDARLLSVTQGAKYTLHVTSPRNPLLCSTTTTSWYTLPPNCGIGGMSPRQPDPEEEQELRMNGARSDLTQAMVQAQNVRAARADISILTAARDQLLSELAHARALGLPEEELHPAELQRRKLHNAIQDLKGQVRVFCRMRPLNDAEKSRGDMYILRVLQDDIIECPLAGAFHFNGVFAPGTQEDIFDDCQDLVQSAMDGHNVTIFSYGQTGAGKTFTMYGTQGAEGLVGRMVKELFRHIDGLCSSGTSGPVFVEGSMAEIYNSRLIDLLKPVNMSSAGQKQSSNLRPRSPKLRQSKEGATQIDDLTWRQVSNLQQLKDLITHGFCQRSVAETVLNTCSSRSHLIFTVKIVRTNSSGETLIGKLVFCDLGGSERLKKTEAVGERKKEAIEINKSLAALGDVIEAVAAKRKHVPYRNHALTRILQDSLGGTAKTLMFVHCSPASSCANETAMSLKFAARAGRIFNSCAPPAHRSNPNSSIRSSSV